MSSVTVKLLMFNNYVNILNPTEGFFCAVNTAYQTKKLET